MDTVIKYLIDSNNIFTINNSYYTYENDTAKITIKITILTCQNFNLQMSNLMCEIASRYSLNHFINYLNNECVILFTKNKLMYELLISTSF